MNSIQLFIFSIIIMIGFVVPVPSKEKKCMYILVVDEKSPDSDMSDTNDTLPTDYDIEREDERWCNDVAICRKNFNITYIKQNPYYAKSPILNYIRTCCGDCTNITVLRVFPDISELSIDSIATSNFVYPFLGSHTTKTLYGFHFIPTLEAPTTYYFTLKEEHALVKLLDACLQMYPLIVICLLMAVLSGFIAWLMETWSNKDEFPREFLLGWFEGFWWSFVSMTTVGYGDKTPRTFAARIFSVIWILTGIITFDILTATLTAQVTSATTATNPTMEGEYVGALKFRTHEAHVIAKLGGKYKATRSNNFTGGIMELVDMVNRTEISGFLLDMYSVWYANSQLKWRSENDSTVKPYYEFFKNKLRSVEKTIKGEKLSYGILVRDYEDYEYFHDYVVDNALVEETMLALEWNFEKKEKKIMEDKAVFLTSDKGPYFKQSIKIGAMFLGVIITFGFFYELYRRKSTIKKFKFREIVKVSIENYGIEMKDKEKNIIIKS